MAQLLELLRRLADQGNTVAVAEHRQKLIAFLAALSSEYLIHWALCQQAQLETHFAYFRAPGGKLNF